MKKIKVLVVDDDRRMVKTICDILNVKGYESGYAFSGAEAVEKVKTGRPDCVLMDVNMPEVDGVAALRMMKKHSPDLPVILMSAYATEEQVNEAKQQGAYTVLTKPMDIQMVLSFLALLRKEKSVLIVDDDPLFCRTLTELLQSRNYHVESETDPEKVLDRMEKDYKLVVVLDIKLGEKNGLNVLRDIRAKYPAKPVVLLTSYREDMSGSIEKGMQIGAYTCLYKPMAAEALTGLVEEISIKKKKAVLGEPFEGRGKR
jgi:two-component system response regulator HydG